MGESGARHGTTIVVTITFKNIKTEKSTTYTVTVNSSEFKVKYSAGEITAVAIADNAYDDNTPGQQLAINVNGGSPITVRDLLSDGYFVEFSVTSKEAAYNGFFKTGTNQSRDGVLSSAEF